MFNNSTTTSIKFLKTTHIIPQNYYFDLFKTTNIIKHGFHNDWDYEDSKTSIFYVNTNDGYTEFEDGTVVESVENRLVTFPSPLKHTGTSCTDTSRRMVININYF